MLKVKEIGRHESWQLRSQHMLVVVLSGEVVASAVDKEPLENVLSGEQDNLEAAIGMDIPTDEVLALHTAASESMDDPGGVADESALPEDAAPSSEVAGMSLDDWQRVFEQTDEDCSGSLSSEEIFIMLKACKIDVEFHDVEHLVAELDDDGAHTTHCRCTRNMATSNAPCVDVRLCLVLYAKELHLTQILHWLGLCM